MSLVIQTDNSIRNKLDMIIFLVHETAKYIK